MAVVDIDVQHYFIGGGAEHSAEQVRRLVYGHQQGASGVCEVSDLRTRQLAIPGAGVRVAIGSAFFPANHAGAVREMYFGSVVREQIVQIPPNTGTQPRYDLIVMRARDPFVNGSTWPDPGAGLDDAAAEKARAGAQYVFIERIPSVPSGTKRVQDVAGYTNDSAYTIARVRVPVNEVIRTADITDLRQVHTRRVVTEMRINNLVASEVETLTSTAARGEAFPNAGGAQYIDIPSWATRMQIEGDWVGIMAGAGDSRGDCWLEFGPLVSGSNWTYQSEWNSWNSVNTQDAKAIPMATACDIAVPTAIRGTNQRFVMKARLEYTSGLAARPTMTAGSSTKMRITFYEDALSASDS